eukprot:TRINITY_DN9762_c0_g1_i1.p1 TRINITY_DN9762_c0_g1~~TRINITY_DN9762_c0_g1_i1.p1  ORF type:complete len:261 (-),score=45.75 TRINITY_DN9762_c0_g1_i1:125-907(-)
MAYHCGFFGLAIFPCLFYYDEALRRDAHAEALHSDASSELRQMSSDQLELRDARIDAKLDASLYFKRGAKKSEGESKFQAEKMSEGCRVKVGDTHCEFAGPFSSECCELQQAEVCVELEREYLNVSYPVCDKINGTVRKKNQCSVAEKEAVRKTNCLHNAIVSEKRRAKQELTLEPTAVCPLKKPTYTCEMHWLSPACCEQRQFQLCRPYKKEINGTVCDKFKGKELKDSNWRACHNQADLWAIEKNGFVGNCQEDETTL